MSELLDILRPARSKFRDESEALDSSHFQVECQKFTTFRMSRLTVGRQWPKFVRDKIGRTPRQAFHFRFFTKNVFDGWSCMAATAQHNAN